MVFVGRKQRAIQLEVDAFFRQLLAADGQIHLRHVEYGDLDLFEGALGHLLLGGGAIPATGLPRFFGL